MKQKIKTFPDISLDSPLHQQAKDSGKEYLELWTRNVIDKFKFIPNEQIKEELRCTAHPFSVCFENFVGDFNIATGIRNANAFNARSVYYIGNKKFDRRGTQGCHNYMDINFLSSIDDLLALKKQYTFIGIDNIPGAIPLSQHTWQENSLLIFGSEGVGLTPTMQSFCEKLVYIPMFGSIRSLNVGTATGIIMYDFVRRFHELD